MFNSYPSRTLRIAGDFDLNSLGSGFTVTNSSKNGTNIAFLNFRTTSDAVKAESVLKSKRVICNPVYYTMMATSIRPMATMTLFDHIRTIVPGCIVNVDEIISPTRVKISLDQFNDRLTLSEYRDGQINFEIYSEKSVRDSRNHGNAATSSNPGSQQARDRKIRPVATNSQHEPSVEQEKEQDQPKRSVSPVKRTQPRPKTALRPSKNNWTKTSGTETNDARFNDSKISSVLKMPEPDADADADVDDDNVADV